MKSFKFAEASDIPEIRRLWDIAFGNEKDFNEYYFKNIFDASKTLICKIDGKFAAMTQMLEYTIHGFGNISYIYGAATMPEFRGRGVMTALLNESFKTDKKNNKAGSALIPANSGLFDFYARFGYKKAFFTKNAVYKAHPANIIRVCADDIPFLNKIYENALKKRPHLVRSSEYWAEQLKMLKALGGFAYKTSDTYALGYPDGIQELIGPNADELASGTAHKLGLDEISASGPGSDIPLGMLKPYGKDFDENIKMYFELMYN